MTYLEAVPLDLLESHPRNVRRDLGDLSELAKSIEGVGLLEPLVVAPKGKPGEGFVVIGGHRRLAAARSIGMTKVPCIMRADLNTPAAQVEAMLVENLQRSDLTVMEEAAAYEQLSLLGVTAARIAKTTGRSRSTVDSRLKLMALPEKTRDNVQSGQLSLSDAEYLARFSDDEDIMNAAGGKTGSNVRWAVEGVLRERRWAQESEERKATEKTAKVDDTLNPEAIARREQAEAARLAREQRVAVVQVSSALQQHWVREQFASRNVRFLDGAMRLAAENLVEQDDAHPVLALMGIAPCGPDDDLDDYHLTVLAAVKALPLPNVAMLVSLYVADLLDPPAWGFAEHLAAIVEHCGYEPSDVEAELMKSAL